MSNLVAEVKALLESRRPSLEALKAHEGVNLDRLIKLALFSITTTPALQRCSPGSLFAAIVRAADVGLEVGSALEHAWLVPYGTEADLVIGYRGYQHLMLQSGLVRNSATQLVYDKDDFHFERSEDGDLLFHRPDLRDPGPPIGAYAIVRMKSGVAHIEWMNWRQIMAIKERALQHSKRRDASPWNTDEEQQARKTPLRRIAKWMPLSPAARQAVELDADADVLTEADQNEIGLAAVDSLAQGVAGGLQSTGGPHPFAAMPPAARMGTDEPSLDDHRPLTPGAAELALQARARGDEIQCSERSAIMGTQCALNRNHRAAHIFSPRPGSTS